MRKIIVIFVIAMFIPFIDTSTAARVHGVIYEWYTLQPLENVIVYVNSTPPQRIVASSGIYEFELDSGSYQIVAEYYENNKLVYRCNESIVIVSDGNFTLDLIMVPNIDLNESIFGDGGINFEIDMGSGRENTNSILMMILLVSIASLIILILLWKGKERREETSELPEDLREIVEIIRREGGRTTQLKLRKKLNYSEAKISLMLADLENRGIIEKFKRGRGNIIILKQ